MGLSEMASHVSDTERAIFWTKWRVQQCYRTAGSSEKLGGFYKNSSVKKKLVVLVVISVFLLFCLKTRISRKADTSKLNLDPLDEKDDLLDDSPGIDSKNKINVNEQQDRILNEKFEVNDIVEGFGDGIVENENKKQNINPNQRLDSGVPKVPVLEPPGKLNNDVKEVPDMNDQVTKPNLKGLHDIKTENEKNKEMDSDQKKKLEDIDELDQELKALGERKGEEKDSKTDKSKDTRNENVNIELKENLTDRPLDISENDMLGTDLDDLSERKLIVKDAKTNQNSSYISSYRNGT